MEQLQLKYIFTIPQVVQHISCYCQWVAGCVIEHRVSSALDRLRDVRRQVVEPVGHVGVRKKSWPTTIEAHTALQHHHQLIGDPSAIVMYLLSQLTNHVRNTFPYMLKMWQSSDFVESCSPHEVTRPTETHKVTVLFKSLRVPLSVLPRNMSLASHKSNAQDSSVSLLSFHLVSLPQCKWALQEGTDAPRNPPHPQFQLQSLREGQRKETVLT